MELTRCGWFHAGFDGPQREEDLESASENYFKAFEVLICSPKRKCSAICNCYNFKFEPLFRSIEHKVPILCLNWCYSKI